MYHSEHAPTAKKVKLAANQFRIVLPEDREQIDADSPILDDEFTQDEFEQKAIKKEGIYEYFVSSGDTFGSILTQYDIKISDITLLAKQHRDLRNLKIGQQLSWTLNASGNLQQLQWEVSRRKTRIYDRVCNNFQESQQWQQGEWSNSVISGLLNNSFVTSVADSGLNRTEINAVVDALKWQLDFQKLQKGDLFSVLISHEQFDNKKTKIQLLAARIRTGGKDYYAIHASNGKFYDRNGIGLVRGFMRFPTMKKFRISSRFNLHRVNPVTSRIAPHKGVDFAMPIGTPVVAVGDGEVLIAKHSGSAGYYVTIRHGNKYTTRYMHLMKLLVKSGQKVKRGECIALSGNSGRSTGPHLHFELWINQQAVNPLTARLPYSKDLICNECITHLTKVQKIVSKLQID